jgi:hypothetical protein
MAKYLLSVHTGSAVPSEQTTEAAMRSGYERVMELEDEMRAERVLVLGGRLMDPDQARVVRPVKHRVHAVDGPYIETKEWLGGFYVIEAKDDDDALAWASKVTLAIDTPIEIRPFAAESRT